MSEWPELAALEALVAVADNGSLAAAARATGMAQPNVSRSIARLERRFGMQLVQRSTTGARLTPNGLVVVEWCREVLASVRRLIDGVSTLGEGPGTLRVAASHTIAENLVPGWIAQLRASHADLRVRAEVRNSTEVVSDLTHGRCDIGFIETPVVPRGVNTRSVGHDELWLLAPPGHPLTRRRKPVTLEELASLPLVRREKGSGTREALDRTLARRGLVVTNPVQEASSNATVRVAVASGAGLAVLSELAAAVAVRDGSLMRIPLETPLRRPLRAVWAGPAKPVGLVADLLTIASGRARGTASTRSAK